MKVVSLQSGSNGNCFFVESGTTRLLFDAGISGKKAEERLAQHGRDIRDVDALFISHDHSDHTKAMGVFQRKFGMPIYITPRTLAAVNSHQNIGKLQRVCLFTAGSSKSFGNVTVHSIPTPHDSVDGVAFVVEDKTHRVGILTDLGPTARVEKRWSKNEESRALVSATGPGLFTFEWWSGPASIR